MLTISLEKDEDDYYFALMDLKKELGLSPIEANPPCLKSLNKENFEVTRTAFGGKKYHVSLQDTLALLTRMVAPDSRVSHKRALNAKRLLNELTTKPAVNNMFGFINAEENRLNEVLTHTGIQEFNYENQPVRTKLIDEEIWFVAKDVCNVLDIVDSKVAVRALEDDEKLKGVIHSSGQNRRITFISESGLYALIFKSRKDEAKKFRKYVTSVILPTIRKTGQFIPNVSKAEQEFIDNQLQLFRKISDLESSVENYKIILTNTSEQLLQLTVG